METRDRSPLVLALQHPFVGMVSLALLLFFAGLGQGDVRIDGAVYAWVSKWIVLSSDWLTLYEDHGRTPYFNKPPLQFWLMALVYKVFGVSTWSAKLVTPTLSLLCVVMTYAIARFRFSPAIAATAGIVLTTSYTFLRHATGVRLDPGLALFTLAAMWCTLRLTRGRERGHLAWWALMGAAWGLGMMLKSPIALLPVPISLITFAWLGRRDLLSNWRWLIPAMVCLVIWAPWHIHQYLTHGDAFISIYFGREMLDRLGDASHGTRPIWFYAHNLLTEYWPWLPFAAAGAWLLARKARRQPEATVRLLIVWLVVWLIVAHLAARKYDRYLIPWFPAAAIAAAYAMYSTRLWRHWRRWVLPNVAVVSLLLLVVLEVTNVTLHRLDAPAVRSAAPGIREQVHLALRGGTPRPTIYVAHWMSPGSQCRLRFYTDAEVKPVQGAEFDWTAVPPGNFIALPRSSPARANLPPVWLLAEDRSLAIYRVLGANGGVLR